VAIPEGETRDCFRNGIATGSLWLGSQPRTPRYLSLCSVACFYAPALSVLRKSSLFLTFFVRFRV